MNVSFFSSIWWGPHSLCHLPKVNQHTWTWVSTSPRPRPEPKPVFSHYPWILPPHLHTGLWQGEAERRGPTAQQWATRSASLSWCCWANRQWESPVWCCALSKASSTNTRRAPLEVRQDQFPLTYQGLWPGIKHVPASTKQLQTCYTWCFLSLVSVLGGVAAELVL